MAHKFYYIFAVELKERAATVSTFYMKFDHFQFA